MKSAPNLGPRRQDVPDLDSGVVLEARVADVPLLGAGVRREVPFYPQSLDFSCGPACLLMAMAAQAPGVELSRGHEIDIWREASLVEIGATSRYGLALAARRRGFRARIIGSVDGIAYKRQIVARIRVNEALMELFFQDAREKCRAAGIPEEIRSVTLADIEAALLAGEIPIVLTDTRMFTPEEEVPHWVVVTGIVDDTVYLNNPLDAAAVPPQRDEDQAGSDRKVGGGVTHARNEAVPIERFLAGFGYGGDQLMVAVGRRVTA